MTPLPAPRFLDRRTPPHILTLVAIAGLSAASMNLFLPSLPHMAAWFGTSYGIMQLSVSLYLAMNAVLQLAIGPLADRIGRRPVLIGACALFCLATLGTIVAPTAQAFLVARMGQAVIVAGLVLSRAVVRDMYSAEHSASMIGYVTMGMSLVPMLAPILGGTLDALWSWQASFWFLFAAGLAVMAMVWADLGETAPASSSTSLASQFREAPELLRSPRFWGYCLTTTCASGAFFAYLGGAPFVGSVLFGLTPERLGLFFGAPALGYMAGNGLSGRFSVRVGINTMVLTGSVLSTAGLLVPLLLFHAGVQTVWVFFGFMTFVGLGNGMVLPNATAGMLSVRPRLAGTASGLGGAMMIGGGAILSALAAALLSESTGAFPLLWVMWISSACGLGAILLVIRREKRLARA